MKLSLEELKRIESEGREIPFNPGKTKFWSLDDLAKGKMFSQRMLKRIANTLSFRNRQHRFDGWRGWTKNKRMRSESSVPIHLYLQPEFQKRYFPENADEHEKSKALERLKKDFPMFRTHD